MTLQTHIDDAELVALLEWYQAAGVELAVGEEPVDQFAAQKAAVEAKRHAPSQPQSGGSSQAPKTPASAPQRQAPPPQPAAISDGNKPEEAQALAKSAETLDQLREIMENFEGSTLKARATQLVFADGNPESDVMLIGEAPGREEDLQGKPFVGRSGQLLDRMLGAIGLDRTKVYIANTVPWRPPGNRTPTPHEIGVCLPFLYRQIELVSPKLILTLGAPATQTMFGEPVAITKVRGRWRELTIANRQINALPTLHPAFLLRQPAQKALAWRDMLSLKAALKNTVS